MASLGAKVLQTRSVELAMNHRVRVQVLSSFEDRPGTLVVDEDEIVENQIVSGIAYSRDEAKITVLGVADRPGVAAAIFGPLAEQRHQRRHDRAVGQPDGARRPDLHRRRADLPRALAVLERAKGEIGYERVVADSNVCKVSVIGVGMRSHAGVAQQMFKTLAGQGHQHPGDLDLGDQGQRADRRGVHRAGAARAALPPTGSTGIDGVDRTPCHAASTRCGSAAGASSARELAIMGGAMTWVSERNLVAAITNAGGFGVLACGSMAPERLAAEIAATAALTGRPFGVNLIVMHPQLDELADVCLDARVGHVVLAGGLPPRGHPAAQGGRGQGRLLRAGAGARQEAGAHRRRRARDRGHGGRRPYRAGLDLGPGAGDPALRRPRCRCSSPAASAAARRSRPIWRWVRPACSSARVRLRRGIDRPSALQAGLHPRRGARRHAVGPDRPRVPVIPVRALANDAHAPLHRDPARGDRPLQPRRADPKGGPARDRAFLGRRPAPRGDRRRRRERLADGRAERRPGAQASSRVPAILAELVEQAERGAGPRRGRARPLARAAA